MMVIIMVIIMVIVVIITWIKKLQIVVDTVIVITDDNGRSPEGPRTHPDDIGRRSREVFAVGFVVSALLR